MYNIFKKYILRSERHLLPVINKAKRIRMDDEYLKISDIDIDVDNVQLPKDVVCFEFKKHLLLVVDRFRNQKGMWCYRKIIIFTKVIPQQEDIYELEHFIQKYFFGDFKDKILQHKFVLTGSNLFWFLMGLKDYKIEGIDDSIQDSELNAIHFCLENNAYIKWELETNTDDHDSLKLSNVIYLFSKKTSMKVNLPKYSKDYISGFINPICYIIVINMLKCAIHLKQIERRKE